VKEEEGMKQFLSPSLKF